MKRSKPPNEQIVIGVFAEVFQPKTHDSDIITVAEMSQCCFIGACRVPTWHDHVFPRDRGTHDESVLERTPILPANRAGGKKSGNCYLWIGNVVHVRYDKKD